MERRTPTLASATRWALAAVLFAALEALAVGGPAEQARGSDPEPHLSEPARRMHEHLVALSRGEGAMSELGIELLDGSMASHRSVRIESGKLVSQEWAAPGAPRLQREGSVSDARVAELLKELIAREYWRLQGTRFVPDAPTFLFRFYYGDEVPVDYRCDLEELRASESRTAIRALFFDFVSQTETTVVRR